MTGSSTATLGANLGTLEAGGFVVTETAHAPGVRLPRHVHEHANLTLVVSGTFTERLAGRTIEGGPQCVVSKPALEPHSDEYGPRGMHGLVVEIPARRRDRLEPVSDALGRVQHVSGGPVSWLAARLLREYRQRDAATPLAVEAIILELLVAIARHEKNRATGRPPAWLHRAIDAMRDRFAEPLDLSTLAAVAGVHPVHFAREFRRRQGCTPGEYVRSLRVSEAARLLTETDTPMVQIAVAAGFSHQSHFCRVFKRHTGASPSEFRRTRRR